MSERGRLGEWFARAPKKFNPQFYLIGKLVFLTAQDHLRKKVMTAKTLLKPLVANHIIRIFFPGAKVLLISLNNSS